MPTRSLICLLLMVLSIPGVAANYPCSRSMGGIDHCDGSKFVCKNGKVSASKKDCRSEFRNGASSQVKRDQPIGKESAKAKGVTGQRNSR